MNNTERNAILKRLEAIKNNIENLSILEPDFTEQYLRQGDKLIAVINELNK